MRPSVTRRDLEGRIDRLIGELSARHANLGVTSGRQAVEEAAEPLETRGIVVAERGRFRVRERRPAFRVRRPPRTVLRPKFKKLEF